MVRHAIVQDQQVKRLQRRLVMMEVFERMVAQQRHHASPGCRSNSSKFSRKGRPKDGRARAWPPQSQLGAIRSIQTLLLLKGSGRAQHTFVVPLVQHAGNETTKSDQQESKATRSEGSELKEKHAILLVCKPILQFPPTRGALLDHV